MCKTLPITLWSNYGEKERPFATKLNPITRAKGCHWQKKNKWTRLTQAKPKVPQFAWLASFYFKSNPTLGNADGLEARMLPVLYSSPSCCSLIIIITTTRRLYSTYEIIHSIHLRMCVEPRRRAAERSDTNGVSMRHNCCHFEDGRKLAFDSKWRQTAKRGKALT